ncbi:MAG: chorismate-binding protein [Bacteroidales bacterium]|nr:chorismate-binding protein [Bacteroidales bacterium]MBN2819804.1 chorismate-binding protein [Bacteroidales bacterium]
MLKGIEKSAEITEILNLCLQKNLTFASFRTPNSIYNQLVVQKGSKLHYILPEDNYNRLSGFLVSPFDEMNCCKSFLIEPDIYIKGDPSESDFNEIHALESLPVLSDESHIPEEVSHSEYLKQLNKITDSIQTGKFEKVVLSRVKIIKGNFIDKLNKIYFKLCDSYPNAFVYIFNAGAHLWIGATPEPLLKAENGYMQTVSLAGTRSYSEKNTNIGAWNSKERLEQEYVTRYIAKVLSRFNLKNVELEGPYTKKAGNLIHLRTDFSFNSAELKDKLGAFLSELHPTPAVCGMPKQDCVLLLRKLEKHKREYYSGFLGPIGIKGQWSLFVNLRCMRVLANNLALFIGGGITADSVPEDEWQETEIKAETLLSVIRQIN